MIREKIIEKEKANRKAVEKIGDTEADSLNRLTKLINHQPVDLKKREAAI